MSDLVKQAYYPHAPEAVWAALTDPDALAQWLMPNNFRPELGREFEFRVDPMPLSDGVIRCRVLEMDRPRRMVWSWAMRSRKGKELVTEITWELAAHEGGTRLRLTQSRVDALPFFIRLSMGFGWGTMLKRWLPRVITCFENAGGVYTYRRMAKPPNRYHHKTRTVPESFAK